MTNPTKDDIVRADSIMLNEEEIEKYIDDYIDMGHFRYPELAKPYLIDGFRLGLLEGEMIKEKKHIEQIVDAVLILQDWAKKKGYGHIKDYVPKWHKIIQQLVIQDNPTEYLKQEGE